MEKGSYEDVILGREERECNNQNGDSTLQVAGSGFISVNATSA